MSRCIQERTDVVLRRTRRFLNTEGKNFKQRIRKMMDEEGKKRLTPDEWSNLKQVLTQKVLPILNTMSQMEKDMKWLEKYPLGHHPQNGHGR